MYQIYILAIYIFLPFAVARLFLAGIKNPQYQKGWRQRFGIGVGLNTNNQLIWLHAVSVGEVNAARPLVEYLQNQYPDYELLITTVTPTGLNAVKKNFNDKVTHRYLPYDIPVCVNKFINTIRPSLLLVMETEIWPVLYSSCNEKKIPIALINARMSEKSFKQYKLLSGLCRTTLSYISILAAQSQTDAERFISLGADSERVSITGNLKFDIKLPINVVDEAEQIKRSFGLRPILIAASTHEGEEEIILNAMASIHRSYPDCLLIIAPRHPDRASQIIRLCDKIPLKTVSYSDSGQDLKDVQVFILDTLGHLPAYYAAADIAFVGGSLVPVGGHNLVEPASLGLPVISGKYLFNFREVRELLYEADAMLEITNADELIKSVIELFHHPELRQKMGERAKTVVDANRGNIDKLVELLEKIIP